MKRFIFLGTLLACAGCTAQDRADFSAAFKPELIGSAWTQPAATSETVAANQPEPGTYPRSQITNGWVGGQLYHATSTQWGPDAPITTYGSIGGKFFNTTSF
jgi:hypothetical protein